MIINANYGLEILHGRSEVLQIPRGKRSSNFSIDTSRFKNKFQKRCSGTYLSTMAMSVPQFKDFWKQRQKQPPDVLCKKGVLRNFAKFTGKHLCQRPFFNKVAGMSPATLLKKSRWHRCFPVKFAKFLRTTFLQNTSGQLLL